MPLAHIVGHTQLIALLGQAAARDRVPQSLLFAGPEGVGKRAAAIALAQAVNCPRRGNDPGGRFDACGVCPTCQRIERGQHSDVTLIDRGDDASIKIRVLRERVLDVVGYRPFEARRRVFIIDAADDLRADAQDALLKTLEEPPASAMLILVTAYPDLLLPTIQSRCRRLRFGPLSEQDVARVLIERCGVDRIAVTPLAAASGGSVSRALAERAGAAVDDRQAALGVLKAAASGRTVAAKLKAAAALVDDDGKRFIRDAVGTRLAMLASLLRDLVLLSAGGSDLLANADLGDDLADLARVFDARRASAAFGAVDHAQSALDRNASAKIVADWIAVTV